jgi:uncharacterized protein involved in tolerance to divalent cations
MSFTPKDAAEGREILEHLTEERLVAGGTIVDAEGIHWLGGKISREPRLVVSAYTTLSKLPLVRGRLEAMYGSDAPLLSQFVLTDEKEMVLGWIERNVRE